MQNVILYVIDGLKNICPIDEYTMIKVHTKVNGIYFCKKCYFYKWLWYIYIYISIPNDNVVMCSVGVDEEFNKKCHYVFDKSYNGVLKILKKEGMKYE